MDGEIVWDEENGVLSFDDTARKRNYSETKNYYREIRVETYHRLKRLYKKNTSKDHQMVLFHERLYAVLQRYETLTVLDRHSANTGTQGSLPVAVFNVLHARFGVNHECYASPLNATCDNFCSLFPEVDGYFGGIGTFHDFAPEVGCYEVNPPFDKDSVVDAFQHCRSLLRSSRNEKPLMFVVFTPFVPVVKEEEDSFVVHSFSLAAGNHLYHRGMRQHKKKGTSMWRATMKTCVTFLGNEKAKEKWLCNAEVVNGIMRMLKEAFEGN